MARLRDVLRAAAAFALLSAWLVLLLLGWSFGGAVYLLLAGALLIFPWRELRNASEGTAAVTRRRGPP